MDDKPAVELPPPSPELALGVVNLMLLTEMAVRLGVDLDGSHTIDRAQGLVGHVLQLDPVVRVRPGGDTGRPEALHSLAAYLRRVAPLVTRVVRAQAND